MKQRNLKKFFKNFKKHYKSRFFCRIYNVFTIKIKKITEFCKVRPFSTQAPSSKEEIPENKHKTSPDSGKFHGAYSLIEVVRINDAKYWPHNNA